MKLIITIPKEKYIYIQELERGNTDYAITRMLYHAVKHGTPLDDVKAEINNIDSMTFIGNGSGCASEMRTECLKIIDKCIGKAER